MILIININVNNDKNIRNCNVVAIYCVVIGYVHIVFVLFEHRRCMHKSLRKKITSYFEDLFCILQACIAGFSSC